jgi:hypothetical protein
MRTKRKPVKVKTYPERELRRLRALERLQNEIERRWLSGRLSYWKLEELVDQEKVLCAKFRQPFDERRRDSQAKYIVNNSGMHYPPMYTRRSPHDKRVLCDIN